MRCDICQQEAGHARWCSKSIRQRYARLDSGSAILSMVRAAERYAVAYHEMFDSRIADDGVLGPPFREILSSLAQLLNGELGAQDGGNLDRKIREVAVLAGYEGAL